MLVYIDMNNNCIFHFIIIMNAWVNKRTHTQINSHTIIHIHDSVLNLNKLIFPIETVK